MDVELLDVRRPVGEPVRHSMRLGDDFDWLGRHSANQEAPDKSVCGAHGCSAPPPSFIAQCFSAMLTFLDLENYT